MYRAKFDAHVAPARKHKVRGIRVVQRSYDVALLSKVTNYCKNLCPSSLVVRITLSLSIILTPILSPNLPGV